MGWKTNKNGIELKNIYNDNKEHFKRLFKFKGWSHSFVNIHVELARWSAYHAGHIWAIQTAVTIILLIIWVV